MLKIKDNVDLKELEKYGLYPFYEVNTRTGETRIKEINTTEFKWEKLKFVKKEKSIAEIWYTSEKSWVLKLSNVEEKLIDLDTLYDLIKDGLVEKVND